jgi:anti-sigma regulatory factor (Ser/Thr protein kinase)
LLQRGANVCPIVEEVDVFHARRAGVAVAGLAGFAPREQQELVIVVSELATNILKYGVRGEIRVELVDDEWLGPGVEITARDEGPPIIDLASALRDGCSALGPIDPAAMSRRKGIGAGLGAVLRFSHSFEYRPERCGKRIRVARFVRPPNASAR